MISDAEQARFKLQVRSLIDVTSALRQRGQFEGAARHAVESAEKIMKILEYPDPCPHCDGRGIIAGRTTRDLRLPVRNE